MNPKTGAYANSATLASENWFKLAQIVVIPHGQVRTDGSFRRRIPVFAITPLSLQLSAITEVRRASDRSKTDSLGSPMKNTLRNTVKTCEETR